VGSEDDGGEILETEVRESVIRIAFGPLSHECNILTDTSIQVSSPVISLSVFIRHSWFLTSGNVLVSRKITKVPSLPRLFQ
jgi:hypothetical protein